MFDDHAELSARIDDPDLPVTPDTVLVLRNAGPVGAPGFPEWGNLPIPKKLLAQGVRDMVRISDARMSGTHYGTCVLHVAPEAAVGGPLALVRTGDMIELDVPHRRIAVDVTAAELERRRAAWKPPRARVRPRLDGALPPARHAGRRGLRPRLPGDRAGGRAPGAGAGHLLTRRGARRSRPRGTLRSRGQAPRNRRKTPMELPRNAFKHALVEGRTQFGTWLMSAAPSTAEAMGCAGFDFLVVDMEHVPVDTPQLVEILRAVAGTPAAAVTRLPWNDTVMVKRALDGGAQTLMFPFVQDEHEAQRAVAATRYPPAGVRGAAAVHRASRYGNVVDYLRRAADELCVVVQLETRRRDRAAGRDRGGTGRRLVVRRARRPRGDHRAPGRHRPRRRAGEARAAPPPRRDASASPAGSSAAIPRWRGAFSTTATRGSRSAPT